ncbi:Uncharacterized protein APZ42_003441 [Daphnia magna]|uniref:Uncharacterized protein n=1 Tax=Daphnia magna TaxID=35525 RepID=A0A164HJB7_9CRUS|nr:Uncharacterized protein APZ42_003441 [Daphnia magna]
MANHQDSLGKKRQAVGRETWSRKEVGVAESPPTFQFTLCFHLISTAINLE